MNELDILRETIYQEIDNKAGQVRLRYITSVPGQSETYMMKYDEAKEYVASDMLSIPPFILAEMNATGLTALEVANSIIQTRAIWKSLAVAIEENRRLGKENVKRAPDSDKILQARDEAIAKLDLI